LLRLQKTFDIIHPIVPYRVVFFRSFNLVDWSKHFIICCVAFVDKTCTLLHQVIALLCTNVVLVVCVTSVQMFIIPEPASAFYKLISKRDKSRT
jgi:hypothetical protein